MTGHRDGRGLFGDHEHGGVGLLGQSQRGAVAGAERLVRDLELGERKHAAGADDAVAPHQHGAVVQRRVRREDGGEQVGRHLGLHRDADEMNSSSPMSPSTATMAPVPARDSRSIASAISSATDWRSLCEKRRMSRDWPRRARAFRSSGWNTTTAANAPNVNTYESSALIIVNLASSDAK